jgi:hypothetical protein
VLYPLAESRTPPVWWYSDFPTQLVQPVYASGTIEERMARLEASVAQLTHFIKSENRPSLETSALNREPDISDFDLAALSQKLQKQASGAKNAKDNKDVEKLREQ